MARKKTSKNRFVQGDRVISISECDELTGMSVPAGFVGTVVVDTGSDYGVEWDDANENFHDLGGRCRNLHGYWVHPSTIELFSDDWDDTPGDFSELFGEGFG